MNGLTVWNQKNIIVIKIYVYKIPNENKNVLQIMFSTSHTLFTENSNSSSQLCLAVALDQPNGKNKNLTINLHSTQNTMVKPPTDDIMVFCPPININHGKTVIEHKGFPITSDLSSQIKDFILQILLLYENRWD